MKRKVFFILALIVFILILLMLILFYGKGKVSPGNPRNIESIKTSCNIACSDKNIYDYCVVKRRINDGKNPKFEGTCHDLSTNEEYLNRNYGINSCSEIECEGQ